jgi:hypothetical protein
VRQQHLCRGIGGLGLDRQHDGLEPALQFLWRHTRHNLAELLHRATDDQPGRAASLDMVGDDVDH